MVKSLFSFVLLLAAAAGCGKTLNPDRCCIDAADCAQLGLDEESHLCGEGLACVANECVVASCSTQGCMATAPVCDIQTDVCQGCGGDGDCDRFTEQPVCAVDTGACVECVGDGDCSATAPICDANACRACKLDSECGSGACGDNGACIAETAIVYMDPGGVDTGTCTSAAPCRTLRFAIARTAAARPNIVMNAGAYTMDEPYYEIKPDQTSATSLTVHGGGSNLIASMYEGPKFEISLPLTIRDLTFTIGVGRGLHVWPATAVRLEHVTVQGDRVLEVDGDVTVRDFIFEPLPTRGGSTAIAAGPGSSVTLERGTMREFYRGVESFESMSLNLTNVLFHSTSGKALYVPQAQGSIAFVTIAHPADNFDVEGPLAVACGAGMTIRNSIVWAPSSSTRLPVSGCNIVASIVGPRAITGVPNTDPRFVSAASKDFHLQVDSPAKDVATSGPPADFEGDPRPSGDRFDIGADETR